MKKRVMKLVLVGLMIGCISYPANTFAEEGLEKKVEKLESEKAELEEYIEQLESEKKELERKIAEFEDETEDELQTEVIGVVYTDKAIVKIVQQTLNNSGYECGTPDGVAGNKTVEALKSYQKEKGINVNGVITDELLEEMQIVDQVAELAEQEAKMKEYSSEYSYIQIARDADAYVNVKMTFKGEVLQEGDAGSGIRYIRLANNSDYDQVIFVSYEEDIAEYRILEDDIITIYGTCYGEYTYETVMGASLTIPWIHADIIDMSDVNM